MTPPEASWRGERELEALVLRNLVEGSLACSELLCTGLKPRGHNYASASTAPPTDLV